MAKIQAVRILFDQLSHKGKQYNAGQIEKNPSDHLIELARNGTRYWHRELKQKIRVAEFVEIDADIKKLTDGEYTLEMLQRLSDNQLTRVLVKRFGFSRKKACEFPRNTMVNYILNLQQF